MAPFLGLLALLAALFPANVYAALNAIPFRGAAPTPLWLRAPIQLVFMAALYVSVLRPDGST